MIESFQSVWTDTYTVHWCDAATNGKASMISLSRFLQESALRHANHLGVGFDDTARPDKIWVVVRMQVEVLRYPSWAEKIIVRTWPRGVEGHFALRDFEIIDNAGNVICGATSRWLILDAISHTSLSIKLVHEIFPLANPRKAINPVAYQGIPAGLFVHIRTYIVQYSDIDRHNHVNNTCYLEWIMNSYPASWHREHEVSGFRIDYLNESHIDDEIIITAVKQQSSEAWIKAVRSSDSRTIFKALINWK
jgi:medium-chain acyl-[acyl-carrier-protein] hydrolase